MNKTKLLKRASLVAMTAMLPFSQVATAGEVNISGWVNEGMFYYDDGNSSDVSVVQDNGTTLATRINFIGTQELPNSGLTAGFEKHKVGAKVLEKCAYIQTKDNFALEALDWLRKD